MNRIDQLKVQEGPAPRIYPPLSINKARSFVDWMINIVVYCVMKKEDNYQKRINKENNSNA